MTQTDAAHRFVSWLQRGAATQLATRDGDPGSARASLPVSVSFNENALTASTTLDLFGPADITSFDARAISRSWPPAGTLDAEGNYFPLIEFAQPDLPWRYTPRQADTSGRLRPWYTLLVAADAEIAAYEPPSPDRALGAITLAAGTPVPDPTQAWAWAHVQISGDDGVALGTVVSGAPERCLARLLSPRRLRASTTYWACLVPTFEAGRLAGLRLPVAPSLGELAPAWTPTPAGTLGNALQLPVYYRWHFGTGPDGDFESLVRKLVPEVLPATAGLRALDVATPGGELPAAAASPLSLGGALIAPDADLGPAPTSAFVDALAALLNLPADVKTAGGDPIVAPPLYGTWHAQRARLQPTEQPPWFQALNADPRLRVPAALGAQVVQTQQDALMAAAWQQVAGIREANAQLRTAQLARELSRRYHARFVQSGTTDRLLQLLAPVHVHTASAGRTVLYLTRNSPPRAALCSPMFRRIRRARGPIGRRQARPDAVEGEVISAVNLGQYGSVLVATPSVPSRILSHDWIHTQQTSWHWPFTTKQITLAPARPRNVAWDPIYGNAPEGPLSPSGDSPSMAAFRKAALAFAKRAVDVGNGETLTKLATTGLRDELTAATEPGATIAAGFAPRLAAMLRFAWAPADPLDPVMAYPVFPQPMYAPLAALSQDWMMPGLADVGGNTVTLAETNDAFIEAYMVGLNHEMARELLWNDYPTDQRGSYFRQFWDPAGLVARPTPEAAKDITALDGWPAASALGTHSPRPTPPGGKHLVLVVRSEVLRRYPNTVVYAQRAVFGSGIYTLGTDQQMPVFSGRLSPDVAFFGFALTQTSARGSGTAADPGWFFVFQEQPHAPRFGLDIGLPSDTGAAPTSWDNLAWPHLVDVGHSPDELGYIDLRAAFPHTAALEVSGGPGWHVDPAGAGKPFARGADHAAITQQRPVRVAMHAIEMLPA